MAGRPKTPGLRAERAEIIRRYEAGEAAGPIATAVGVSLGRVERVVQWYALQRHTLADRQKARAFLYGETVALLDAYGDRAETGDIDAAKLALAIMDRLAKLTGADAPAESRVTVRADPLDELTDEQLDQRIRSLAAAVNIEVRIGEGAGGDGAPAVAQPPGRVPAVR